MGGWRSMDDVLTRAEAETTDVLAALDADRRANVYGGGTMTTGSCTRTPGCPKDAGHTGRCPKSRVEARATPAIRDGHATVSGSTERPIPPSQGPNTTVVQGPVRNFPVSEVPDKMTPMHPLREAVAALKVFDEALAHVCKRYDVDLGYAYELTREAAEINA